MSGLGKITHRREASALAALLILVAAFASTSCGGSDPGQGTQDLHVEAYAFSGGTRDSTYIHVQVRENDSDGRIQPDATVTNRGYEEGEWDLEWVGIDWGPITGGLHILEDIDWQEGWYLDVELGEDRWLEAYLEVPGYTTITSPIANTSYRPTAETPLDVQWEDSFGRRADHVDVELNRNDYELRLDGDPRSHEIPASNFDDDGSERITIERFNEIDLAGGARGSFFVGTTRHRVDFTVEE
ncbi:MAG: hypothetical protein ACOC0J_00410 [Myxococcota bacterium]